MDLSMEKKQLIKTLISNGNHMDEGMHTYTHSYIHNVCMHKCIHTTMFNRRGSWNVPEAHCFARKTLNAALRGQLPRPKISLPYP